MDLLISLRLLCVGLTLGVTLSVTNVHAADPCPWQDAENASACAQWDEMVQRLEAAEARAQAAEKALQSMESVLKTMEETVQSMQQNTISTQPTRQVGDLDDASGDAKQQQARAFIDKLLSYITMSTLGPQVGGFVIERDYELVQQGDTYTATFQEAGYVAEEIRFDFGPIVFTIEPVEEGISNVSIRLGDSIRGREGDTELFTLLIGSQDLSGTWSDKAQNFLTGKTELRDLKLTVAEEDFNAGIGSIDITQNLELQENDEWTQQQTMAISSILLEGSGNSVSLDDIDGSFLVSGREYSKLINIGNEIQKMMEENVEKLDQEELPTELLGSISGLFSLFDTYSMKLQAGNLDVAQQGMPIAKIQHIGLGGGLSAAEGDADTSRFSYYVELKDFDTQMAPLPPDLLPRQARIEMALSDIPGQMMHRFIEIGMASEQLSEAEKDDYFQQQLLGLLMGSQLKFDIIDTFVAAESARFDLNAHTEINPQSAMGGVGSLSLKIENMQTLIDITGAAQDQSIAPMLAMITAFSDRTEQNGKTIDNFDLEFTAEGKLFLNGKDITAMVMPGSAPPAQ